MTARPMMAVLAGSFMLVPLALAQDHAVPRGGGGGGGSMQSHSGGGGGGATQSTGSSSGASMQTYQPSPSHAHTEAGAALFEHAVSRGGGGGGSSSHSGSSHGSSSSSGSSARSGGSSSGSHPSHGTPSGGSGSVAERRHPRAGTGSGGHHGGGSGGYYPYYPYYDYGYYPGWGWGSYWWPYGSYYDGWYGGGYWGYPYGGWGVSHAYVHRDVGSVRILVEPSEARVYVDGFYAGTVDDFDGLFQRLNTSPGRHEITLKLEGYKTHRIKVYVPFESTLKLHYDMEKGSGETFEDQAANVPERELQREREREQSALREEGEQAPGPATLRLNVNPPDASVYVDGAFRGTARESAALQLPPGRHRLEIVRPGYRTVEREVETSAGEPTELTIELDKTSI
jgi:hypothetical protein